MKIELSQPITLDVAAEEGEKPRRTLSGVAVPFNTDAVASTGRVRFQPGSLPTDGPAPKLIRDHDLSKPIGIVTARISDDSAMLFEAKISETADGNEALTLAADGVLDAVSVGVEVEQFHYDGPVMVVESGRWKELSLVPFGAFDAAKVLDVAAEEGDTPEPEETPTPQDSEEEIEMSENNELVEAAPAPVEIPTAPIIHAEQKLPSAGAYVAAQLRGNPIKVQAATGDTADIPGAIPSPLVGEIFDTLTSERPMFSALGARAMPLGDPFYARKVTGHSAIGTQALEHDALASQAMTVAKVQVDKVTLGGYIDLSEQEVLYAEDNVIQLVIEDMAKVYAETSETWVGDTVLFANASAATQQVTSWTDGDEVITDLYAAAAEIYANFGRMPTHLIIKPSVWASVGAAKDSGGNRIFPYLSPVNAAGTLNGATSMTGNPLGLQLIVSDKWDTTLGTSNAMMLSASAVQLFEDARGALRVEQPATLSTRLAFRGYVAAADYDLSNACLII